VKVLDETDGQGGGSVGVKGVKERYWARFLKGMVTDRNNLPGSMLPDDGPVAPQPEVLQPRRCRLPAKFIDHVISVTNELFPSFSQLLARVF
jgi:hypothetical protein